MPISGDGPFHVGQKLKASQLNDLAAGRKIQTAGAARVSQDAGGQILSVDDAEIIYIRLTEKDTAKTPIRYGWKEVCRQRGASGSWVWLDTTRTAKKTDDYAVELNNQDLSVGDNYVYRAERSPHTGEWLFFLRKRQSQTKNITFYHPQVSASALCSASAGGYYWMKVWGVNLNGSAGANCTSLNNSTFSGTYQSVQYWYKPDDGTRSNLTLYQNNNMTVIQPSPFSIQTSNLALPGVVGADIVFYDSAVKGSNSTVGTCCNYNTHGTCNLPTSVTVTANVTANSTLPIKLPLSMTVTADPAPNRTLNAPKAALIKVVLSCEWPGDENCAPTPAWLAWRDGVIQRFAEGFTLPVRISDYGCSEGHDFPQQNYTIMDNNNQPYNFRVATSSNPDMPFGTGWAASYLSLVGGQVHSPGVMNDSWDFGFTGYLNGGSAFVGPASGGSLAYGIARFNATSRNCGVSKSFDLTGSGPPVVGYGYLAIGTKPCPYPYGTGLATFQIISISRENVY